MIGENCLSIRANVDSMFDTIYGMHRLNINVYTKLVANLVDDSLFLK